MMMLMSLQVNLLANTQSASLAPITAGGGATQAVGLATAQSVLAAETGVWWECTTVHQLLLLSHFLKTTVVLLSLLFSEGKCLNLLTGVRVWSQLENVA